jgi:spore coat polysaccharide biosynthesis protein SpsF
MTTVAIIQSRMSSRRLPGKNLRPILGRPMLARLIERLKQADSLDRICVATSSHSSDDPIEQLARAEGVDCFRGSLDDVLQRVTQAAQHCGAQRVVDITGDCPLVDPRMVDACVRRHARGDADYVYLALDRISFPPGLDIQVYARDQLERVEAVATSDYDRNNVTPYFYHHPDQFRLLNLYAPPELDRPRYFLAVDYPQDFDLVTQIFGALQRDGQAFGARDVVGYLDQHPELARSNARDPATLDSADTGGAARQELMLV